MAPRPSLLPSFPCALVLGCVLGTACSTGTTATTAPTVQSVSPSDGAAGVSPNAVVSAVLDEKLKPASVGSNSLTVTAAGADVAGTVTYDETSGTITFSPAAALALGTPYTATVHGVENTAGNALKSDKVWAFTTVATLGLAVTSHTDGQKIFGSRNITLHGLLDASLTHSVTLTQNGKDVTVNVSGNSFSAPLTLADNNNALVLTAHNGGDAQNVTLTLTYPFLNLKTFQSASRAIGQPDFTTVTPAATDDHTFYSPPSPAEGGPSGGGDQTTTALYLSDTSAHRILGFSGSPANGASADFVLGQSDFSSSASISPPTASSVGLPTSIMVASGKLWAVDQDDSRILVWESPPMTTQAPASFAIGQPDLTSDGFGCARDHLNGPQDFFVGAGKLIVNDSGNYRTLIWNTIPAASGALPDIVLGQGDFTHCAYNDDNQDGTPDVLPTRRTEKYPVGTWTDGARLVVGDAINCRVLIWNTFPTANFQPADVVLGSLNGDDCFSGGATAFVPDFLTSNGNQLFVTDAQNSRVLIWDVFPTEDGQPATTVLGQSDFVHLTPEDDNQDNTSDSGPTARVFNGAAGLRLTANGLWVTDTGNRRYLLFSAQ